MLDIGSNRINLQDLDFFWSVRSEAIEGGTLFGISNANKMVRLSNCTITIENLAERDEVFAFEINKVDDAATASSRLGTAIRTPLVAIHATVTKLADELQEREDIMDEAREAIEKLEAVVAKVTAPANRIGTFLTAFPRFENGRPAVLAQIVVGGRTFSLGVDKHFAD